MDEEFEDLVKRISRKLKGITYKLNGHFTFFDEDDLYQEALLHLWDDFSGGRLSGKNDSYILQGCYFYLKNHVRKTMDKKMLVSLETLLTDEDGTGAWEEKLLLSKPFSCFEEMDEHLLHERMDRESKFTERQRQVFAFSVEGLTTRDIGQRLGISHVRVVKIRKDIAAKIKGFMYIDNVKGL